MTTLPEFCKHEIPSEAIDGRQSYQNSYVLVQKVHPEDPAKVLLVRRANAMDICPREILQSQ